MEELCPIDWWSLWILNQPIFVSSGDSLTTASDVKYIANIMMFSTYDADHDTTNAVNCAASYRGAWWHNSCFFSNLNGPYSSVVTHAFDYIVWRPWTDTAALKETTMMIREKY
jgi:hypothetical protein